MDGVKLGKKRKSRRRIINGKKRNKQGKKSTKRELIMFLSKGIQNVCVWQLLDKFNRRVVTKKRQPFSDDENNHDKVSATLYFIQSRIEFQFSSCVDSISYSLQYMKYTLNKIRYIHKISTAINKSEWC